MLFNEDSQILRNILDNEIVLHLYSNDINLNKVTTVSDFVQPINFIQRILYDVFWDIDNDTAFIEEDIFFDGPIGKVYGYFTTSNNNLMWAERFTDGPYNIQSNEDKIKLEIALLLKECK